jgi:hypothetical protein
MSSRPHRPQTQQRRPVLGAPALIGNPVTDALRWMGGTGLKIILELPYVSLLSAMYFRFVYMDKEILSVELLFVNTQLKTRLEEERRSAALLVASGGHSADATRSPFTAVHAELGRVARAYRMVRSDTWAIWSDLRDFMTILDEIREGVDGYEPTVEETQDRESLVEARKKTSDEHDALLKEMYGNFGRAKGKCGGGSVKKLACIADKIMNSRTVVLVDFLFMGAYYQDEMEQVERRALAMLVGVEVPLAVEFANVLDMDRSGDISEEELTDFIRSVVLPKEEEEETFFDASA